MSATAESNHFAKRWREEFGEDFLMRQVWYGGFEVLHHGSFLPAIFTLDDFVDVEKAIAKAKAAFQEVTA